MNKAVGVYQHFKHPHFRGCYFIDCFLEKNDDRNRRLRMSFENRHKRPSRIATNHSAGVVARPSKKIIRRRWRMSTWRLKLDPSGEDPAATAMRVQSS